MWGWPDERVLGGFLDAVVLHGLSFKLTGGLHHAVRGSHGGEPMHGLLNVLLATHEALHGAEATSSPASSDGVTPRCSSPPSPPWAPTTPNASARASRPTAAVVCSTP